MNQETTSRERTPAIEGYPSRLPSGSPELVRERGVPVVWSTGADRRAGPLSEDELARFDRDGWLAWPGFFGEDEVTSMRTELRELLGRLDAKDERVVLEPDREIVRSVFAVHRLSARYERLSRDPRLLGMTRQILGDDVYLHQTRLNLKPGFEGREFWWHSDFETWHQEDGMPTMRCFSAVIALSEVTPHNGPVLFVPGSHRTFVGCVGETPPEHHRQSLRAQTVGVPSREVITELVAKHGLVAPTGPAGTLLLFDCNLLHGSGGNVTPLPRHHLFFVYSAVSNRVGAPASGTPPRPEHIATRETFEVLR